MSVSVSVSVSVPVPVPDPDPDPVPDIWSGSAASQAVVPKPSMDRSVSIMYECIHTCMFIVRWWE